MQSTYLEGTGEDVLGGQKFFDSCHPDPVAKQFSPSKIREFVDRGESGSPILSIVILTVETDFHSEYGVFSSVCFFSNFFLKDAI